MNEDHERYDHVRPSVLILLLILELLCQARLASFESGQKHGPGYGVSLLCFVDSECREWKTASSRVGWSLCELPNRVHIA